MRKIEREYIKICSSEGFDLLEVKSRKGHLQLCFECGSVFCAGSPSDNRNLLNVRAQIRRLHQ